MAADEAWIWYLTWRAEIAGARPAKTRLVKLLYLIDLHCARNRGQQATSFRWRFYHYGPYPFGVEDVLEAQTGRTIDVAETAAFFGQTALIYRALEEPPEDLLRTSDQLVANRICDEWALADLNDLLSYVYFETPPMRDAHRGDWLDLVAHSEEAWPRSRRPLDPPDVDEYLRAELERWRAQFTERFPVYELDPRPGLDALPPADSDLYPTLREEDTAPFRMTVDLAIDEAQ